MEKVVHRERASKKYPTFNDVKLATKGLILDSLPKPNGGCSSDSRKDKEKVSFAAPTEKKGKRRKMKLPLWRVLTPRERRGLKSKAIIKRKLIYFDLLQLNNYNKLPTYMNKKKFSQNET